MVNSMISSREQRGDRFEKFGDKVSTDANLFSPNLQKESQLDGVAMRAIFSSVIVFDA